jgi:hypothetical protein
MKGVMSHIGTNLPIRGVTCRRYTYLLTVNFRILLGVFGFWRSKCSIVLNGKKTNGINADSCRFLDDPTTLHRMAIVALNRAHEASNARNTEGVCPLVVRSPACSGTCQPLDEHANLSTLLN